MTNAKIDDNHRDALIAVSTVDGETPVRLEAVPSTSRLLVDASLSDSLGTANVVAGDTGFNGVATAFATKTIPFTTSASGVQTILADTDIRGYSWIEVMYTSVGSGLALTGQFSMTSGGTYQAMSTWLSTGSTVGALGVANSTIYYSAVHGDFFQIAVSALSSGTFAGKIVLHASTFSYESIRASQVGTWTVQPGNTPNTTPWLVSAAQVYSIGGAFKGLTPTANRITINTTTTLTSSTAYISSITVVTDVAGTTSTVTIQDKSGTPLKLVDGFTTVAISTTPSVFNFMSPVLMTGGIDIVTAGVAAATVLVWVNYYQ